MAEINLLLRGQSNAILYAQWGLWDTVAEVRRLLGFTDQDKVNVIADYGQADGHNTMNSGTAFLTEWMARGADNRWTAGRLEQGLLDRIGEMSAAEKANPTAVIWLHNEYDQKAGGYDAAMWEAAVRADAGMVRAALDQPAARVPYLFVSGLPYAGADQPIQAIKEGMERLAADASFNADIAARVHDLDMDGYEPPGGSHMGPTDAKRVAARLALSIAEEFASYARPGSPVALAQGDLNDHGPYVSQVATVAGHANQLVATVTFDQANHLVPLDATAAAGRSWAVVGADYKPNWAVAAELIDGSHIKLTFAAPVDTAERLHFGYGYGRTWSASDGSGRGHSIYDNKGMPVWTSDLGVAINAAPANPLPGDVATLPAGDNTTPPPVVPPVVEPPVVPPAPASWSFGSGPDILTISLSESYYLGHAQAAVRIDGVQIGPNLALDASHGTASNLLTIRGDFAAGRHSVSVTLLNDAWGGSASTDRNVYIDAASYNGTAIASAPQAVEQEARPGTFTFIDGTTPVVDPSGYTPVTWEAGNGPDTLVLRVSEDYYNGHAQFSVKVDGASIGTIYTTKAAHGAGSDILTLRGDWGPGDHSVEVKFLNDAWGGNATLDRNLHLDSASYNGTPLTGVAQVVATDNRLPGRFTFTEAAAPITPEIIIGTGQADTLSTAGKTGAVLRPGLGADTLNLGPTHLNTTIAWQKGDAAFDVVSDFRAGDRLDLTGYGAGSSLIAHGNGLFTIIDGADQASETFYLAGVSSLAASAYLFQ